MRGYVLAIILGLLTGVWEVAMRPFLPGWAAFAPILPVTILFLVTDARLSHALTCVCIGAIILDLFSFLHSDIAIVRYVALILFLEILAHHFLTNQSWYTSLGMIMGGRLLERTSGWIFEHLAAWLSNRTIFWAGWHHLVATLIWDAVCVGIGFIVIAGTRKRSAGTIRTHETDRLYDF